MNTNLCPKNSQQIYHEISRELSELAGKKTCLLCDRTDIHCKSKGLCNKHYKQAHKQEALDNGICINCRNNPHMPGKKWCQECLCKESEIYTKKYHEAKNIGICVNCNKNTPVPGKTKCQECMDLKKIYDQKRKEEAVANGCCNKCLRNPHKPGKKQCQECISKNCERNNKRYADALETGTCTMCFRKPALPSCRQCQECLDLKNERQRADRAVYLEKGICINCHINPLASSTLCRGCLDCNNEQCKKIRYEEKMRVFDYFGAICNCPGCGITERDFLTIDHINNDGAAHRREIGGGSTIYRWLTSNDFPPGFQVLCGNCQVGKLRNGGVCPCYGKPHN